MRFEFLTKYFPSPKFLKPPHIGVSFSDFNIKAMKFGGSYAKHDLKNVIVPLPKGVIADGKIINMDEVVKKLSIIKENFDVPFIFFTIPDELAYIFSVSVPIIKGGNATESVAFTIEENVPFSLNETVFDFTPVRVIYSEPQYKASVVVVATVKKEIEKFIEAIQKSGLEGVGCVHESQAIANAVMPKNTFGTFCIVHSRENRIGIYLIKNNIVHFATLRSISEGDYKKQFLDEYDKFLEYSFKYDIGEDSQIKNVFVCGQFEYAKYAVEAIIGSDHPVKDAKLANVWTNVLSIEKDVPSISYEDSLNLAGPIGSILSDII